MAYTDRNFKSKKALKEAVAAGDRVTVYQPGPFPLSVHNDRVALEGPHYPEAHKWYAQADVRKDGDDWVVVKVK